MTGNVPELNDPANSNSRINVYPSALVGSGENYEKYGNEPSIRGRQIYVPLNIWFTLSSKMAMPLVSLQYVDLTIEVSIRPVNELFVVRNISSKTDGPDYTAGFYRKPNFSDTTYSFYKFIHQPPKNVNDTIANSDNWESKRTDWNADVHLIATYGFLSDAEVEKFAREEQRFLIKEVYSKTYHNIFGSKRQDIFTQGLVADWMWFFQRSDAPLRNEWSNYSNWPYQDILPYNIQAPDVSNSMPKVCDSLPVYPDTNIAGETNGIYYAGTYQAEKSKRNNGIMGINCRWEI